jgi:PPM family protein phosphatase
VPDTTASQPLAHRQTRAAGELAACGLTDQGLVRKNNEDNLAACDLSSEETFAGPFEFRHALGPWGVLLLVADGMGGQACGELASRLCSDLAPANLLDGVRRRPTATTREEIGSLLAEALQSVNRAILAASREEPDCHGMGTTATAALVRGSFVILAQIGDSRAYLIRNGHMTQLTRDQTFLNYLVEMGVVDATSERREDPRRSILVQALGTSEELRVALTSAELKNGDRLLLSSDGLYGAVGPDEIREIAAANSNLGMRCRLLVDAANREGGPDNITLILADISSLPESAPGPVQVESLGQKT